MSEENNIPAKIESCLQYMRFCQGIRSGPRDEVFGVEAWKVAGNLGRELDARELTAYNAALDAITKYFRAPNGWDEGMKGGGGKGTPPDDPKERIPVNQS